MRVGFVRSDVTKVYLSDIENTSQRNFSSEPRGQSRYFTKPSDEVLSSALASSAALSIRASNTAATVNTSANNVLRIKSKSTDSFTVISVTAGATTAKTLIVTELNAAFANAGLPLVASVVGTNQVQIDSTGLNRGPGSFISIDSVANGSTLNSAVGFPVGVTSVSGLTVAALKTAVYPTSVTIDVSSATIVALSTFSLLTSGQQSTLVDAIADVVAPKLVETGPVLLSFAYGILSKLRSASFQPGGSRIALPAGVGVAVVENDGTTPFVL